MLDYELYAGPALDPDRLLYDDDGLPYLGDDRGGERLVLPSELPVVGPPWTLFFSTRPGFAQVGVGAQARPWQCCWRAR